MEVERKYLVRELPSDPGEETAIRQGYLALDGDVEVRVRERAGSYVLTVKGGEGVARAEVQVELDAERFEELWPLTDGRRIEKRRRVLGLDDGRVAELDLYAGPLDGLATVEVEFESRADAEAFEAPTWFGEELTGVAGWSNAELATRGRPDD